MRKLLIISILGIVPSLGCTDCLETMRRVEVWKAQHLFAPSQPVTITPASSNPCGAPIGIAPACPCPQGAASAVMSTSAAVSAGYPAESEETVSTEELNGVLKQP